MKLVQQLKLIFKEIKHPKLPEKIKKLNAYPVGDVDALNHLQFYKAAEQFIQEINKLIENYNAISLADLENKKKSLLSIQQKIRKLYDQFQPAHFEKSIVLTTAQASLEDAVLKQAKKLNTPLLTSANNIPPIVNILGTLTSKKINKLLDILIYSDRKLIEPSIKKLYKGKKHAQDASVFKKFLSEHQIQFLGGANSLNYKVTNLVNNKSWVLKVEFRLNSTEVRDYLLQSMCDTILVGFIERMGVISDKNTEQKRARFLTVTEFLAQGSLDAQKNKSLHVAQIAEYFMQMSEILLRIQEAGCIFPDAKNANWLVNDENKLIIADTKSFLFTNSDGYLLKEKNPFSSFVISTRSFAPPEYLDYYLQHSKGKNDPSQLNADKFHAYTLGRNLYFFLSKRSPNMDPIDLNHSIFTSEYGQTFKELIQKLTEEDATKRLSLQQARKELYLIKYPEVRAMVAELSAPGFPSQQISGFLEEHKTAVKNADSAEKEELLSGPREAVQKIKENQHTSQSNMDEKSEGRQKCGSLAGKPAGVNFFKFFKDAPKNESENNNTLSNDSINDTLQKSSMLGAA
ncbi:hypothetical protein [Legionella septentrionalis]|uniref:hypothetical protein n=1 Tax=Legionella septentrionalis TaxID=2498109 RepID=UPI000F8E0923|nr:hypothetical protein [Legionella septentrionalis]RUQ93513.1 hypothetical protein ELY11_11710 [Legionella septentrionalis]